MKNNVCLITGGAGFLGTNIAIFLKKNYKVLCIDNHKSNLKKLSSIKSKNLHTFICDITNEKSVKLLFNKINKNFFVNVLINNATIDAVPFSDQKKKHKLPNISSWDKELNVGLKGSFLMIKYFGEKCFKKIVQ